MEPSPALSNAPRVDDCDLEEQVPTTDTLRPDLHGTDINGSEDTNKIVSAINAQSESLRASFESMTTAIEALKQKPQSPDKKIAFWTAYKSLADEFDKEIQEKYKDDLNTSLIFAGLFSAVSSAFIIQIQPKLQPDPNGPTQALLALLVQNILRAQTSQAPVASSVVVAQSLLYFSLFATLMAVLLAVLGKQWLLHYNSIGERGTIAEQGLKRQHKFNGMC
ncbi:hypothetical protein DFH08DRAFT_945128 [Mycena albidolilacea]|uniref:DUF6535 domain-containing protein n=1 Tax=Mycena albidolilacea TaxID=1033008 RepID=A0AAD6Z2X1_9AGAR|nr:hypothetical protein DFH08DRAFT_945128 [Mycena albidolilacea]